MAQHLPLGRLRFLVVAGLLVGACSSSSDEAADVAADLPESTTSSSTSVPAAGETADSAADLPTDEEDADESVAGSGELVFPAGSWATAEPADTGIDEAALATLVDEAEASDSTCLLVTRNGKMVGEWYWGKEPTDQQQTFSATKSFTAGLLGMASDAGHLAISDPASDYITEWQGTGSETVLVEDLLQNDSGRHYDFNTDYVEMAGKAVDKSAFAIELDQQHEPGTVWEYNNSAIQTLETVLERALGEPDIAGWGTTNLLEPIGMTDSTWLTDDAGNALTFMGIESTCRDMARYGLLWLADGDWDGQQIISSEYVEAALQPVPTNGRYGYLWWQHDPAQPMWPSSPDTYAAMGMGGQFISVDPDTGIVVSRQALGNDGSSAGLINLAGTLADAG